ncbi:MerR family transcriptional regulator [Novosphingobium sp.]|uniref:MerR family transcriptional regulator n=1 Tax=Novosphingobium sp. TaxID=1874826 RepID=UPI0025FD794F|nr:MerR family transcriptional regulator [Novosphingobium sp.]
MPESVDAKAPEAFRTIGEVAALLGVRQHVLRYWEDQFPQLRPLTRAGSRRYYRPGDVALAAEINRLLHSEGFTIRGAKQLLAARGGKSASVDAVPVEPEVAADPAIASYLRVLRNRLASALERDSAAA